MKMTLCPYCMKEAAEEICPHCGKPVAYGGEPAHLQAGFVLNGTHPYILGAALGQGGFGITYIALDMVTNQRVAIKEYYPTYCAVRSDARTVTFYRGQEEVYNKGRDRFLDEARVLKSLSDIKSIVNVLDFFEANNTAYLVMEFLEGDSLKSYAMKNGKFPAQAFIKQLRPLMEDIDQMHQRGVVHRDIAPDNIILMPDGQMKLIDFGAARSYVGDKSMTVVVKKGFAPIEQYMRHGSTAATDVYALAATIYYCTTGTVPPDSAERQYEEDKLKSPTSLGAELSKEQERAILKALEVQPKKRTQSVAELVDVLEHTVGMEKLAPTNKMEAPEAETELKHNTKFHQCMTILAVIFAFFLVALVVMSGAILAKYVFERKVDIKGETEPQSYTQQGRQEETHIHSFKAATCTTPKTCITCGYTEGTLGNHNWISATYTSPMTCSVCGATSGNPLNPLSQYNVGDVFAFGKYEQDGLAANGMEPISWRVLSKEADKIFVISEYGLESRRYHSQNQSVNWNRCSLRLWLNDSFYNVAFSAEEKNQILVNTDKEAVGNDKLFLLSYEEVERYFSGNNSRVCYATRIALNQGAYASPDMGSSWWLLRTAGKNSRYVMSINTDGSIDYDGGRVSSDYGVVRPAMWLDISSKSNLK